MKKIAWLFGLMSLICFSAYASQTDDDQFDLMNHLVTSFDSQNNNRGGWDLLKLNK